MPIYVRTHSTTIYIYSIKIITRGAIASESTKRGIVPPMPSILAFSSVTAASGGTGDLDAPPMPPTGYGTTSYAVSPF